MLDPFLRHTPLKSFATLLVVAITAGEALANCAAERPQPMVASDPALCQRLEGVVRKPSARRRPQARSDDHLWGGLMIIYGENPQKTCAPTVSHQVIIYGPSAS